MSEPARLVALYTAPAAGAPVVRVPEARALEGRGLEGDRYAAGAGSFSRWPGRGRAVTLISADALREAEAAFDVSLADGQHRRNLVVEGLDPAVLRGVPFQIGEARFEGVRPVRAVQIPRPRHGPGPGVRRARRAGRPPRRGRRGGVLREGDVVVWDPADAERAPRLPG